MKDGYFNTSSGAEVDLVKAAKTDDKIAIITRIKVPKDKRGQGYASALMEKVTTEADEEGTMLVLAVESYDNGLSNEELVAWYERMGFVWMRAAELALQSLEGLEPHETGLVMVRKPMNRRG